MNEERRNKFFMFAALVMFVSSIFLIGNSSVEAKELEKANQKSARTATETDLKKILEDMGVNPPTIITSMNMDYSSGNDTPTIDDKINFTFNFAIPDDVRKIMTGNEQYQIVLPDTFKIANELSFPLEGNDGNTFGTVNITKDGVVTINFNDNVTKYSDITGKIEFDGEFNEKNINESGDITIKIPGEEQLPSQTIHLHPKSESVIEKKGFFDQPKNPNKVTWYVDINKSWQDLKNATVKDVIPDGLTLDNIEIYKMSVDPNGNILENSGVLLPTSEYQVNGDTISFNNDVESTYRIVYTTTINDNVKPANGGTISFANSATLSNSNTGDVTATSSVDAKYNQPLVKSRSYYDQANQTLKWDVEYNYRGIHINKDNAILIDKFSDPDKMTLLDDFLLRKISFDAQGNLVYGDTLKAGTDYVVTKTSDGFKLEFLHDIDYGVNIQYQTKVEGIIDKTDTYTNSITAGDVTSNANGTVTQHNVLKRFSSVDYDTETITWQVDVNINKYKMTDWTLIDQLETGLTLKDLTIVDRDTNDQLTKDVDYTITNVNDENDFKITFINKYNPTSKSFRIVYTTHYDINQVPNVDLITNKVTTNWIDDNGTPHNNDGTATFKPNDPTKYNGGKYGSYDPQTKLITWTIFVDYTDSGLERAQIDDPIPGNQQFIHNSIKVYFYHLDTNGNPIKDRELNKDEYDGFAMYENRTEVHTTIGVQFPNNPPSTSYMIEFQTSLEGEVVNDATTYHNVATFYNDKTGPHELWGDVDIANAGKFIEKDGYQDDQGYARWNVTVNPSLSTMNDVEVIDTPSTNQFVDLDSLVVNGTIIGADGSITVDNYNVLKKGIDYDVTYEKNSSGVYELKVKFKNKIDTAYIISYRATTYLGTGDQPVVSNDVKIKFDNDEVYSGSSDKSITLNVTKGSGVAVGTKGKFAIKKVDENNNPLKGAEFELYDSQKRLIGSTLKSDDSGIVEYDGVLFDNYVLKEVKAPDGYSIDSELFKGRTIVVDEDTTVENPIVLVNESSSATFNKVDENNNLLADAKFTVQKLVNNKWETITLKTDVISKANGQITIRGLGEGKYRLIESSSPNGYLVNTTPIEFEMSKDDEQKFIEPTIKDFVNYKGKVKIIKVNNYGDKIKGAKFQIKDNNGRIVADNLYLKDSNEIVVSDMSPGTYSIIETKAPKDHKISNDKTTFTIDKSAKGEPKVKEVKIVNDKIIPKTPKGGSNEYFIALLVLGSIIPIYFIKRNYKKSNI